MKAPQLTTDENGRIILNDYQANFRFLKTYPKDKSLIVFRANTHGNISAHKELSKFDCLIRAINWGHGIDPLGFSNDPLIKFNSIEDGNKFLNEAFKLLKKHAFNGHITSSVLGTQYYDKLPKGFIEIRIDKKFYHYVFNLSKITFERFDFEPLYKKHYESKTNLYNYNFETGKIEPNKNNPTWV